MFVGEQLPVLLPDDITEWKPTGESPLKFHPTWKDATCPLCGKYAVRETDTLDTFMCSSWYHMRYLSPQNDKAPLLHHRFIAFGDTHITQSLVEKSEIQQVHVGMFTAASVKQIP